MSEKIKDCPFCGSECLIVTAEGEVFDGRWVVCGECSACSGTYVTKEEAIINWNSRYGEKKERK